LYSLASSREFVLGVVCDRVESTYKLFTAANDDRDLADFCPDYLNSLEHISVESLHSQVEQWVTEENVNLFQPNPLEVVTSQLCNLSIDPTEYHRLKEIASYLIGKGAKLHGLKCWGKKICLLAATIASTAHPFDSQIVGTRLLEMLAASNVDVAEYLAFERQHHPGGLMTTYGSYRRYEGWPYDSDPRAVKLDINEEHPFSLSWGWWVDPKEEAFIVLQEFRDFGRAEYLLGGEPEPAGWSSYWPFFYPDWTRGLSIWSDEEEKAFLKRIQQRSHRRWKKKMIKEAKMQGTYKKPKMPGTWIH
jgi:hypothetical protein